MTLDEYLKRKRITSRKAASTLRVSIHTLNKWRQRTRIPLPRAMMRITKFTEGKVSSYSDFIN